MGEVKPRRRHWSPRLTPGPRLTLVNRDTRHHGSRACWGMKLWPRFSYLRLPHVGSHAGADDAKVSKAHICVILLMKQISPQVLKILNWGRQSLPWANPYRIGGIGRYPQEAAISLDKIRAHPKEKVMFLRAFSLVRGGPDPPQGRRERLLSL